MIVGVYDEPDGATPLDLDEKEGLKFDVSTRGELNDRCYIQCYIRSKSTSRKLKSSLGVF